jgi:hypothetical protein
MINWDTFDEFMATILQTVAAVLAVLTLWNMGNI